MTRKIILLNQYEIPIIRYKKFIGNKQYCFKDINCTVLEYCDIHNKEKLFIDLNNNIGCSKCGVKIF